MTKGADVPRSPKAELQSQPGLKYQGGSAYPIVFPLTKPPFGENRSFSGRYNLTRYIYIYKYMDVSENSGFYPKSSMD